MRVGDGFWTQRGLGSTEATAPERCDPGVGWDGGDPETEGMPEETVYAVG